MYWNGVSSRVGRSRLRSPFAPLVIALVSAIASGQTAHFAGVESVVPTTSLSSPHGLSVDPGGALIVADTFNFRLLKEAPLPGGGFSETVLYSGSSWIFGGAVDSSGNVYVADTLNNRVLKETLSGGTYTQSLIGSGLDYPESVAVDASGNVYIADSHNDRVLKETFSGGTYTQSIVASGSYIPLALAISANGNIYIADYTNNLLRLETLQGNGTYVQTTIPTTGLSGPTGVTVDAAGDVYVVDFGNKRVLKETLSGGSYAQSVLDSGMAQPYGVTVDASGNVYVSDGTNNNVLHETTGAADFGSVAVAATSPMLTLLFNFDAAGTLGSTPYVVSTQGAVGLDFADAGGGTCAASTAYAAGASCTVNVKFTPETSGTRYGGAWLQGSANTTIASGYVMGTGTGPQVNFLPYTQTVVASGLDLPRGLALDAAGNLYVAETNYPETGNFVAGRILKETLSGSTYTQSVLPTSGLWFPVAVFIGGSGNVYVTDTWHFRILNETWGNNSYTEKAVTSSGLSYPSSAATDASGSVYIADANNNRIVKETLTGTNTYTQTVLPFTGLSNPTSVALDASENLYIGDGGNNRIVKGTLTAGTYAQSTITTATSLSTPTVSVDPWGNLYIADRGNNRVIKETISGSRYVESTVGSGFSSPNFALSDGRGNVFVADTNNGQIVKVDYADAPILSFPTTYAGNTSSAQTVTVSNVGNMPLNFLIPSTGRNPSVAANFSWNSSGGSACPDLSTSAFSVGTLAGDNSCLLPISFAPAAVGSISGSVVLQDTALNAATTFQTIPLSGTALGPDATAMTLTATPSALTVFNSSTFTATVSDTLNSSYVPTGSVTFADTLNGTTSALNSGAGVTPAAGVASYSVALIGVGTHTITATSGATNVFRASSAQATVVVTAATPALTFATIPPRTYGNAPFAVSATSASSGAVTYSVAIGPATVSGTTVTLFGAGTVTLTATQAATSNYTAATQSASFTVSKATPTLAITSSSNPSIYGDQVKFTFTFTGSGAAIPTGTAIITEDSNALTTVSLDGTGKATCSTSAMTANSHTILAVYNGDGNYQ